MKTRVNEFFDNVTPVRSDDEIIADVLRKAENMNKQTKKFNIKKPVIAACAAVCILGAGVTAAAATGLIDFEAIFSRHIAAENDMVAGKLLANVDSVVTQVSDDNYNAELKAVISDSGTIIGCIELSRKDGMPVADSFVNPLPDLTQGKKLLFPMMWEAESLGPGYQNLNVGLVKNNEASAIEFVFNENGGLDMYFDLIRDDTPESGKVLILFSDIYYMDTETDEHTLLLPIDVRVQFGYEAADNARVSKTISDTENTFEFINNSGITERACIEEAKFNCASVTFKLTSLEEEGTESISLALDKPFVLIKDSKEVGTVQHYYDKYTYLTSRSGGYTSVVGWDTIRSVVYRCQYRDLNGNIAAFDISEIDAVEINGTIYPLK